MNENIKLSRSLSLTAVVVYGMAFMALTTVFSTYGIASQISHGMVAGSYNTLIVMMFTAYSLRSDWQKHTLFPDLTALRMHRKQYILL